MDKYGTLVIVDLPDYIDKIRYLDEINDESSREVLIVISSLLSRNEKLALTLEQFCNTVNIFPINFGAVIQLLETDNYITVTRKVENQLEIKINEYGNFRVLQLLFNKSIY